MDKAIIAEYAVHTVKLLSVVALCLLGLTLPEPASKGISIGIMVLFGIFFIFMNDAPVKAMTPMRRKLSTGGRTMDRADITNHGLQEIRCGKCRKVIAYGYVITGHIELKCASCATINSLRVLNPNPEPQDGPAQETFHA